MPGVSHSTSVMHNMAHSNSAMPGIAHPRVKMHSLAHSIWTVLFSTNLQLCYSLKFYFFTVNAYSVLIELCVQCRTTLCCVWSCNNSSQSPPAAWGVSHSSADRWHRTMPLSCYCSLWLISIKIITRPFKHPCISVQLFSKQFDLTRVS